MATELFTLILILTGAGLALVLLEGWMIYMGRTTISEYAKRLSAEKPYVVHLIALIIGLLFGHFWW